MVDRSFDDEHRDALNALRRAKGACPDADVLLDYAAGSLDPARARDVEAHLSLCPSCEEAVALAGEPVTDVDDLTWKRAEQSLDRRGVPWRPRRRHWISAAAGIAAVLALAAVLWPMVGNREATPVDPQTRGAVLALEPAGTVNQVERFGWQAVPLASAYRVTIEAPDGTRQQQTTTNTELEAAKWFTPTATDAYRWRVEALDDSGKAFAASDWQPFQVPAR